MYSKGISDIIPETLTVEGMDDTIFDPTTLLIKPDRKVIPGLCKKGMFNLETKSYENAGLFQQIAFTHADEYNRLINNDNGKMHRDEWEAECKRIALEKIVSYCRDLYADKDLSNVSDDAILDAAYDNIARSIFNQNANVKEGMDTVLKQCFWNIFGDRAVRILKQNKMIEEMEEVDSDSDDDEDYDVSLLDNID
jgi:hypothetical protein